MTIKKKILAGYGVAFTLMSMVFAWSVINLVSLGTASNAILQENYRSILSAENMIDALERQDSSVLLLLMGDTLDGAAQFRENEALFLQWLGRARDNITIRGEDKLITSIESGYNTYRRQFFELITRPGPNRPGGEPLRIYNESFLPVFLNVRETCIELRNLNEKTMYKASVTAGTIAERAIWSTVLVGTSALFIALIFSILLAERIVRPLKRVMEASQQLAGGDYKVQVPVDSRDELGRLAGEFNRMAARLGHYNDMNIDQILSEKNKADAILSSIEDGMVVFDKDLNITAINPAAQTMLNLEFTGTKLLRCGDILPATSICTLIEKVIGTGIHEKIPDEKRIVSISWRGQTRYYLFSITAIRGRSRDLSGIVLLLKDVTRLKEVEQLKSDFIMAASHELRTPLTGMGMSIDLLLEHAAPKLADKDRELLHAAHEEVLRMKALVNDLLELSRIEAGHITLEFEQIPVKTLFDNVQGIFTGQLEKQGVKMSVKLNDDMPAVRADANKITWVLTNLISNAMRYVGEGGNIVLKAEKSGPSVHLSVQDDGPGIPPDYQQKIFQKFVQVKGRENGGSGLGLAICKEIVRAHGGVIWVESPPSRGSTFIFTLPAA